MSIDELGIRVSALRELAARVTAQATAPRRNIRSIRKAAREVEDALRELHHYLYEVEP